MKAQKLFTESERFYLQARPNILCMLKILFYLLLLLLLEIFCLCVISQHMTTLWEENILEDPLIKT